VAIYFLWLGHYTTWLVSASLFGLIAWADVTSKGNDPSAPSIPYFAGFMALWATCFMESWKRKEAWYSMKWGTVGFEEEEQARPQFEGKLMPSAITGERELFFSEDERSRRASISGSIIFVLVLIVLVVVAGLFYLRYLMVQADFKVGGTHMGPIITSIIQAVVISVLNYFYGYCAEALNDNENHRTDTEYEDALIAKVFIFQYVNSYAPLFYIAFIKPLIPSIDPCLNNDCMKELQTTLGTMFLTNIVVGIILSVSIPMAFKYMRERDNFEGLNEEQIKDISEIERLFMKEPYDVFLGTFTNFSEMAIQFGYTTMFISAFPLAASMSLVNNYIMLRYIYAYTYPRIKSFDIEYVDFTE
jgi:heme/copper-type cytochrome/quinol oxidase subunit 2